VSPQDVPRSSAEGQRLLLQIRQQDAARRARWRQIDQTLERHAQVIADLLEREREQARYDARLAAEVAADSSESNGSSETAQAAGNSASSDSDESNVSPANDLDTLAAVSAMDSPAFLEWRRAHSTAGRGLFGI
jgi:hypothetical protein